MSDAKHESNSKKDQGSGHDDGHAKKHKKHGGGGLKKDAAIEEVAKIHNKSVDTIIEEYKSDRGKKVRAMVKERKIT